MVVVDDAEERLLLWMPAGTRRKVPAPRPNGSGADRDPSGLPGEASHLGVVDNLATGEWAHTDHTWDVSSLWLLRPEDWHAVWVSWLPGGEPLGWYVNFQRPYRRTAMGIEAMDLMLDVVVELDGSWRWKDRLEFETIARHGLLEPETVNRVYAEADTVVARIEAAEPPFCDPWHAWTPDESWATPHLPPAWQRVPESA